MLSYTTPRATMQQVLQKHVQPVNKNLHVQKVLQRIKTCRTSALGYHVYQCSNEECGHVKYQYHSCRDRHCPNCGAVKKQEWIEARMTGTVTGKILSCSVYLTARAQLCSAGAS